MRHIPTRTMRTRNNTHEQCDSKHLSIATRRHNTRKMQKKESAIRCTWKAQQRVLVGGDSATELPAGWFVCACLTNQFGGKPERKLIADAFLWSRGRLFRTDMDWPTTGGQYRSDGRKTRRQLWNECGGVSMNVRRRIVWSDQRYRN